MKGLLKRDGEGQKPPFVPSEAWLEKFETQLADKAVFEKLWRFAYRRGQMIAWVRPIDPDRYASDLIADIVNDTIDGKLPWDPARCTLRKHVRDHAKSRSRHEYARALKRRHTSLQDPKGQRLLDDQSALVLETEAEKAERIQAAAEIVERLEQRAANDPEVSLLLDAIQRGAEHRADVLSMVGLTTLQYDAARKRLDRMIDELPNQMVTSAQRAR